MSERPKEDTMEHDDRELSRGEAPGLGGMRLKVGVMVGATGVLIREVVFGPAPGRRMRRQGGRRPRRRHLTRSQPR
jgi:hypothetical protein